MRGISYQEFLNTDFWRGIREECLNRDQRQCQNCKSPFQLRAHHRFYRPDWFDTRLADLVTLCDPCHGKAHSGQLPQFMGKLKNVKPVFRPSLDHRRKWLKKLKKRRKFVRNKIRSGHWSC